MTTHHTKQTFKSRLRNNELCLCMAATHSRTADLPLIVQATGFDAFYVDMEHYPISEETASMLCTAALGAGVTSLVRVPSHDQHFISRVLDGGATGVIVPHVDTAEQARAVVNAARFPPLGERGVPGPNAVTRFQAYGAAAAIAHMDPGVVVVAMVESPAAIEAADEIAAVDGIDMLLVGSNDLALKMGIPGELRSERIFAAYEKVAAACRRHGKTLGVAGVRSDIYLATRLIGLGARFFIAGSDTGYLLSAATASAGEFRSIDLGVRQAAV